MRLSTALESWTNVREEGLHCAEYSKGRSCLTAAKESRRARKFWQHQRNARSDIIGRVDMCGDLSENPNLVFSAAVKCLPSAARFRSREAGDECAGCEDQAAEG
jgi:hypothetical protein